MSSFAHTDVLLIVKSTFMHDTAISHAVTSHYANMGVKPLKGKRFADIKVFNNSNITLRHVAAPIVGLTMMGLFYLYARSSVHAAKRNAELHRAADGGQISWQNESARRHGTLNRPKEQWTWKGLVGQSDQKIPESQVNATTPTAQQQALNRSKRNRATTDE